MIGVSTLAAMAQASYRLHGATDVAVAIDARMSEVYWARYSRQENGEWIGVDEECVIPPARLAEEAQADSKNVDNSWYRLVCISRRTGGPAV